MTSARLRQLAERRAMLVARAAVQRAELAQVLASAQRPLALFDHGMRAGRKLARYPHLLLGLVVCAAVLRPWRLLGWVQRGLLLWRTASTAKKRFFG